MDLFWSGYGLVVYIVGFYMGRRHAIRMFEERMSEEQMPGGADAQDCKNT